MPNEPLPELNLDKGEKALLPLGFSKIFIKDILPRSIEYRLKYFSRKYRKFDYPFAASPKPISKIITYKESPNKPKNELQDQ